MTTSSETSPRTPPLFAALELSPEPVLVTDRRNRIVFWNNAAQALLGYMPEEVVGSSCASRLQGCDTFGNRYCSDRCPITEMALRNETVRHFNLKFRAKDKSSIVVDVTILNLSATSPDMFYLVHILKPVDQDRGVDAVPTVETTPLGRDSLDARVRRLTQREIEVLRMMAGGHSSHDIATRLRISPLTARNHIQNILEKIEVHSKAEAVAFAFQKKVV